MAKVETIKREKEEMKNGMMVNRNMNGEDRANEKLEAGIKNIPKTLTLQQAIELLNKKRAN